MEKRTIAVGADHAAFSAKEELKKLLQELGWEVTDFGTHSTDSCNYPDFAHPVAEAVASGKCARGMLLCGTGLGMTYAANRHAGVRAADCWSKETAALAREHNDSNILVMPARAATIDPLPEILKTWLETPFSNGERHCLRIKKIELGQ